jgi:hypothetical protein
MSDIENDRETPIPEDHPTGDPPPPWERKTGEGLPDFRATQPMPPPTAEDVLDVFSHFRQDLIDQIDKRDERILMAIRDIGSQIVAHYERSTKRADEQAKKLVEQDKQIKRLRERTHRLMTSQNATDFRLDEIERRLGIEPPKAAEDEPQSDP